VIVDLRRNYATPRVTFGLLTSDGFRGMLHTLEPALGAVEHPAIADGLFELELAHSAKFGDDVPHVRDVPGRSSILVHPGNFRWDTLGCILPALSVDYAAEQLIHSRPAYARIVAAMRSARAVNERVWLEVKRAVVFKEVRT
jgi:hypothetical protein